VSTDGTVGIIICDEHSIVRYGLTHMLEQETDVTVLAQTPCAVELSRHAKKFEADVVILDAANPNYLLAVSNLHSLPQKPKVIVYTTLEDEKTIVNALEQGACGYLLKKSDYRELIKAIRVVQEGGTYLDPLVAAKLAAHMRAGTKKPIGEEPLSKREIEILRFLATGNSNRDISKKLLISETTVKFHVSSILAKLHVRNRTQAALAAKQHGIV